MSADYDEMRMVVCDRKSATIKTENGLNDTWTNDFNETLQLKPGDRVAVYNSFISEKGAGTPESIEFKQIHLISKTPKTTTITTTQTIPAGDPRNNSAIAESGLRTFRSRQFVNTGGAISRLQPEEVYMDYCDNTEESIEMLDNEASLTLNYYKTMDGLSYFQLPRRWAFDNYRDITGAFNTAPGQWSDQDGLRRGRTRSEVAQICDDGDLFTIPVADTQVFRNIDDVYGYVRDDYKLILDNRTDIAVALPVRGVLRQGRVQKIILKNDNARYTILKRKKNLMMPQHLPPNYDPPINPSLFADFVPPYYAADPESFDYVVYSDKVDLRVEPGFSSSKYVSEELTRQMRSLKEDQNKKLERTPATPSNPRDIKTLTTIEQFVETATYKRFATSNDHYGAEKYYHEILDNSTPPTAPATTVGVDGPTILTFFGGDYTFTTEKNIITYLQQYQYIGCKRPELYVAGSEANDIFGYQVNSFTPHFTGQVLNTTWFQDNPLQIALQYTPENLLKLKKLMDAQGQHPELFDPENIMNMYEPTIDQFQDTTDNPYVYIEPSISPEGDVETWVNIDNARYLHMNPHNSSYYNNLLNGDTKLDANWRNYAQLGCGYYDFRGNFITNVDTGTTDQNQYSRHLNDPGNGGKVSELRYNSLPFMFHRNPDTKDTLFSNTEVIDETSQGTNYTYGCFGRDSIRGEILVYPNMIKATNNFGDKIGVGLPNAFFTDQDGAGNFLIQRGRKVGFDRHFNAWGNACICLTSGIPRLEYQQAYDGTKDFWGTTTQYGMSGFPLNAPDNNPAEGVYSYQLPGPVTIDNDLQPWLNKAYLGADAPAIVFDGAHFSFKDLHTPLNKGNLNTLAVGEGSNDEQQVVYKINPQQSYNNLTPTQLPYEETLEFSYVNSGTADKEKRRMNRNLEPFTIYDTTTGVFIKDFGFNEDVWDESLWGRLGFTYDQFHNSNPIERQKRYTDFTDTSNILTTNADVKSRDIKSWMQNKFGEATYTGTLFHPAQYQAFFVTNATPSDPPIAPATIFLEFLPEIIAPTDSVSVVARDYPTQISHGFYNIRSDIALNSASIMGNGDTGYPIVGIADKTNAIKDFFISSPSSITHTITRPVTLSSITTSITDPNGTPSRCSPNSIVIYRVTRTVDTSYNILGDLKRKLAELEEQKKSGKK